MAEAASEVVMDRTALVVFAAAAAPLLLACEESEVEPRVPVNAQVVQHEHMKNPDIRDGFPQVAYPSYAEPPPAPPSETVSLGYIGDEPLGRYDAYGPAPHEPPYWTRPFGTLPHGVRPYAPNRGYGYGYGTRLRQYDAPYYPYYAPPPP
jgi:hypothetical protein